MPLKWLKRLWTAHADRRRSSPEDRAVWEREKRRRQGQEREEIERRLSYLKAEANVWARKELSK